MTLAKLDLPPGSRVLFNHLDVDGADLAFLDTDLLAVLLPNGIVIDVGWYPAHDPGGAYAISVYRRTWENQLLNRPIETTDPKTAVAGVKRLATSI